MDTPSPYQDQEVHPVLPAMRHSVFRSYPSQPELQRSHKQMEHGWPHIRPHSVLVAAMGNHWRQGSWQRVVDMVDYTQNQGVYAALHEIQDRCFNPYDALGTMRNEAILTAVGEGFEYLCYLDNDVQPEPDTLIKLLTWNVPVIAPFIAEPGTGKGLHGPELKVNTGLQRAKWSVLSMLLFHTATFRATGPQFWRDAIGADEGWHFQQLQHWYGVPLFIDTNTTLVVGGRPLYPLALNRLPSGSMKTVEQASRVAAARIGVVLQRRGLQIMDADHAEISAALTEFIRAAKGDRDILIQQKIERFVEPPDRRPIDPNSPYIKDGEYAPFLVKAEQAAKAAQQITEQTSSGTITQITSTVDGNSIAKALAFNGVGNG